MPMANNPSDVDPIENGIFGQEYRSEYCLVAWKFPEGPAPIIQRYILYYYFLNYSFLKRYAGIKFSCHI